MDYIPITLQAGTFLRGISQQELNSDTNKIGDTVRFINLFDYSHKDIVYMPKNAIFIGNITNIERNRFGRNALMSISLNKLILPSGQKIDISCILIASGNAYLGGEYTKKSQYRFEPHSIERLGLVAQNVPVGPNGMGKVLRLPVGEEITIMLKKPIIYKKYDEI